MMVVSFERAGADCGTTTVVPEGAVAPWGTTTVPLERGSVMVSLSTVRETHPLNTAATATAITVIFIRIS
jgi:hypothetical protein